MEHHEKEPENEPKPDENRVDDVISLEVSTVVQTFMDKLVALDHRVEVLEATTALLSEGFRLLGAAAQGQQKIIEAVATEDKQPELPRLIPPGTVN